MDRGAWRPTVHWVSKSWTWLKWPCTHACMHHYSIIQNSFNAWNIPSISFPSNPYSWIPGNLMNSLIFSVPLYFASLRVPYSWNIQYAAFYTKCSRFLHVFFCALIAHIFLLLNNIPLSRYATDLFVCFEVSFFLFFFLVHSPIEGHFCHFQFWQLWIRLLWTLVWRFCEDIMFKPIWINT